MKKEKRMWPDHRTIEPRDVVDIHWLRIRAAVVSAYDWVFAHVTVRWCRGGALTKLFFMSAINELARTSLLYKNKNNYFLFSLFFWWVKNITWWGRISSLKTGTDETDEYIQSYEEPHLFCFCSRNLSRFPKVFQLFNTMIYSWV